MDHTCKDTAYNFQSGKSLHSSQQGCINGYFISWLVCIEAQRLRTGKAESQLVSTTAQPVPVSVLHAINASAYCTATVII
jgi:hypothetical protein